MIAFLHAFLLTIFSGRRSQEIRRAKADIATIMAGGSIETKPDAEDKPKPRSFFPRPRPMPPRALTQAEREWWHCVVQQLLDSKLRPLRNTSSGTTFCQSAPLRS